MLKGSISSLASLVRNTLKTRKIQKKALNLKTEFTYPVSKYKRSFSERASELFNQMSSIFPVFMGSAARATRGATSN